jgi:hypothetical protein
VRRKIPILLRRDSVHRCIRQKDKALTGHIDLYNTGSISLEAFVLH